jgi:hypothetical protein
MVQGGACFFVLTRTNKKVEFLEKTDSVFPKGERPSPKITREKSGSVG